MIEVMEIINYFLEKSIILVLLFLIQRYVLLEKRLEKKKQIGFYIVTYILTIFLSIVWMEGEQVDFFMLFAIGLNNYLTRKEHKKIGFLMTIPSMGFINGILSPIFNVPGLYFDKELNVIYQFILYCVVAAVLILFLLKGKNWRQKYEK